MGGDPLPNEEQRRRLCELLYEAFIELRSVYGEAEQVHELAYAFHNLPLTMYGWGTWSWDGLRAVLARYRARFPEGGPDYAAMYVWAGLSGVAERAKNDERRFRFLGTGDG